MKNTYLQTYHRVKGFLSQGVWHADIADIPWFKAFFYRVVRLLEHATVGFLEDRCILRASALTYTSLLSLVPLLALMFAILKGLGVQRRLEPFLIERLALGSQELVTRILEYIDRTNVGSLGALGVVTLLISALLVLKNMERSFNWIWKVKKGRTWLRTVSDYLSVLMIAPFCVLVALSLTTYISSAAIVQKMGAVWVLGGFVRFMLKASPFFVLWIAFTFCYLFMPNTRVKVSSALLGGVIGGTLWQLAQSAYVKYQIGMAKYNAIYGALSQLPILMVWLYVSWVIVLLGAEIAAAHQNLDRYAEKKSLLLLKDLSPSYRVLRVLKAVMERFQNGDEPYTVEELSEVTQMPIAHLEPCLERLGELGWIAPLSGRRGYVNFQRPPDLMPLYQVLGLGVDGEKLEGGEPLVEIMRRADQGIESALDGKTVRDLLSARILTETHQEPSSKPNRARG